MIYSHTLRNNVHTLLTQDRDPRAYQIFLGNVIPSAEGQRDSSPSFLASTPERLYVRSGRRVASEAVAATRPRGAEGVGWVVGQSMRGREEGSPGESDLIISDIIQAHSNDA